MKKDKQHLKDNQIFTPSWVTKDMLDLLGDEHWTRDDTYLLEPTCGDGAMLVVGLERIYTVREKLNKSKNRALAETLLMFEAVELDPEMVIKCRHRIFDWVMSKLIEVDEFTQLLIASVLKDKIHHADFFEYMKALDRGSKV